MGSLGARIKTLRKKKKLTLQGLAGEHMTKGMVSLIENDKAKPSMESLHYIAEQLDVTVNELLEEVSITEIRELLATIETYFKEGNDEEVIKCVSLVQTEHLPLSYESAKVLELYGKSLYKTGATNWENYLDLADHQYMTLALYEKSATITLLQSWSKMECGRYEESLHLLREKHAVIQSNGAELETLTFLKYQTHEASLLFAIGQNKEAEEVLHSAISYSRTTKVFYQIEELYRIACLYSIMMRNNEEVSYFLEKLDLYSKFVDSTDAKAAVLLLRSHYHNEATGEYEEAIQNIEAFKDITGGSVNSYYVMEKGKALYHMGDIEGALELLNEFTIIPEWVHPFDRSMIHQVKAYQALCLKDLGKWEKGKMYAKEAYEGVKQLPETPYQAFVYETLNQFL
ncbi:helix-turn-helix transcriptional regulator [Pontibacillus sp. ALD_SL1]|uniref:helix-turn-helix domain-containing protein n=1 Tax=Pontibacillus sp. ALD_SL1 TaxID=2777185 RepID=UPI001A9605BD|nr:helix-turn-helix transcriptional regulator [Pontibacillus sp. ALD_SL1]QSS98629.1 helix-turn-helix transcriptional regulator [Pontibacillus sp. ALD_SL1]